MLDFLQIRSSGVHTESTLSRRASTNTYIDSRARSHSSELPSSKATERRIRERSERQRTSPVGEHTDSVSASSSPEEGDERELFFCFLLFAPAVNAMLVVAARRTRSRRARVPGGITVVWFDVWFPLEPVTPLPVSTRFTCSSISRRRLPRPAREPAAANAMLPRRVESIAKLAYTSRCALSGPLGGSSE